MIEDEGLVGVVGDEVDGLGQVSLEDEDVVDEAAAEHGADAGVEVLAEDVVLSFSA